MIVDVVIPALNEALTLPLVLSALPRDRVRDVYVVDNGSSDGTAEVARRGGAQVLSEPQRGYGAACLRGVRHLTKLAAPPEAVVFLDGDFADDPAELPRLLAPLEGKRADLVIGSRVLGGAQPGALALTQRLGNQVAVGLIRVFYQQAYTDLGPFRAITLPALRALDMSDTDYGWTVEMQVKAAKMGLRVHEVPVRYRRRAAGRSKVSATLRGTALASYKILFTILRHAAVR